MPLLKKKSADDTKNFGFTVTIGVMIVIIVFLGFLIWQTRMGDSLQTKKATVYTLNGISVKANIEKIQAESAVKFLKNALRAEYIPKDLNLTLSEKGNQVKGDAYIANWSKLNTNLSLLLGLNKDNNRVAYMRVWTMPEASKTPLEEVKKLPEKLFNPGFIAGIDITRCATTKQPGPDGVTTICGNTKGSSDGSVRGVSIRTPLNIPPPPGITPPPGAQPPPTVSIVASCFIAEEIVSQYLAPFCI